jgi:NAD(P)H-flavin reductase
MVRQLDAAQQTPRRVVVYYGARTWDDLYALDDLRRMSYRNTWLDVVPVVEERPPVPGTEVGKLVDVVTRYGAWSDCEILVSGSPAMVQATVRQMIVNGTDLEHVHFDPFMVD